LIESSIGMDTRISIGDGCYETMMESGNPIGICINCGNGVCEDIEDVCNCPEDCGAENSDYVTVEDFCDHYTPLDSGLATQCRENIDSAPICELCEW